MQKGKEKRAEAAPGRLEALVCEGLRGHHLLFERDEILAAFALPDAPVAREDADVLGHALLTVCRDPLPEARTAIAALPAPVRCALVRLYFRLLDRAEEERAAVH